MSTAQITASGSAFVVERDSARCYRGGVTFGELCRQLRDERGLSLSQVAKAGGIPQASRVSEIERGEREPSISRARQVARGLGLILTDLVARWEEVELVWVMAGRRATAEAKGANDEADLTERGGAMVDDLGQILVTALRAVPAESREDFVEHCVTFGMRLRRGRQAAATGTDPKA